MSARKSSDSSTSESEVSACSSSYNPLKALYSKKTEVPVIDAPMYENLQQYENAQKIQEILPVGQTEAVKKREEAKQKAKIEAERLLEEKNKRRFAQYAMPAPVRKEKVSRNVLTRMDNITGPLAVLRECVENRIRVMENMPNKYIPVVRMAEIITRNDRGVRGTLHATVVAFDKQWNMALTDVLEIWKRKGVKKRKIPPGMGTPVPKGSAAKISPVAAVTETPLGKGVWECTRHLPQLMVRGEHVVLVNATNR